MTIFALILSAGLFYCAAIIRTLWGAPSKKTRYAVFVLAAMGLLLQSVALALRWTRAGTPPLTTSYELVESIAWALAAIQLLASAVFGGRLAGAFSLTPVAVLTLAPLGCPSFAAKMSNAASAPPLFAATHGTFAALSYAALGAAAVFGAAYIRQKISLRAKSSGILSVALPSLETLERWTAAMVSTSAAAMFVSVAMGVLAARGAEIDGAMVLKFAVGTAVFAGQSALCALEISGMARGMRLAKLSISLFVFALAMLAPIELRTVL